MRLLLLFLTSVTALNPIVVFHGVFDACVFWNQTVLIAQLKETLKTDKVYCVEIGSGLPTSLFTPIAEQGKMACGELNKRRELHTDVTVIGISQGNLISREVIQKCDWPGTVTQYISISGPHMGISAMAKLTCGEVCDSVSQFIVEQMYHSPLYSYLAMANYYRNRYDSMNADKYIRDLNNENDKKNPVYRERFLKLKKLVLVKNKEDSVVLPHESSWFETWDEDGESIVPLKESKFFKEDWLGIKTLYDSGRISFIELKGDHLDYTEEQVHEYIVRYLLE